MLVDFVKVKLVKEARAHYIAAQLLCPNDIAAFFSEILEDEDREQMVALLLDTKNKPIAVNTIGIGTLSGVSTTPREVFKAAILANAATIILAHNHPSGDPAPSIQDRDVTKRMVEAEKILGIQVLDHVIIGHNGCFVSMKASGIMELMVS